MRKKLYGVAVLQGIGNHFQLFGLEPRWAVDIDQLKQCYLELQRECHPDRLGGQDAALRRVAERRSIEINEAHSILADPLKRARYLLEQLDAPPQDQGTVDLPPEFLMEQLQLREQVAERSGDLKSIKQQVETQWSEWGAQFDDCIAARDTAQAHVLFYRMQFIQRLRSDIQQQEEDDGTTAN